MPTTPVTMGSTLTVTLQSFLGQGGEGQQSCVSLFLINCRWIQTLIFQNQKGPLALKVILHRGNPRAYPRRPTYPRDDDGGYPTYPGFN